MWSCNVCTAQSCCSSSNRCCTGRNTHPSLVPHLQGTMRLPMLPCSQQQQHRYCTCSVRKTPGQRWSGTCRTRNSCSHWNPQHPDTFHPRMHYKLYCYWITYGNLCCKECMCFSRRSLLIHIPRRRRTRPDQLRKQLFRILSSNHRMRAPKLQHQPASRTLHHSNT